MAKRIANLLASPQPLTKRLIPIKRSTTMEAFLIIPLITLGAPVLIVLIALRYRYVQTQARYQTLLALADKGVALPTELVMEANAPFSERRRALVLIGAGIGISATVLALPGQFDNGQALSSLWGLGLLPLMTGIGYLTSWWLNGRGAARG